MSCLAKHCTVWSVKIRPALAGDAIRERDSGGAGDVEEESVASREPCPSHHREFRLLSLRRSRNVAISGSHTRPTRLPRLAPKKARPSTGTEVCPTGRPGVPAWQLPSRPGVSAWQRRAGNTLSSSNHRPRRREARNDDIVKTIHLHNTSLNIAIR